MNPSSDSLIARRVSLLWRIHLWAALIASPFALLALLTGVLYIFTPQIENALYGRLDRAQARPGMHMLPLDDLVARARLAAPAGWSLHSVQPPYAAGDVLKANFVPPPTQSSGTGGHHHHGPAKAPAARRGGFGLPAQALIVSVDPYDAEILGSLRQGERFSSWAKRLHSRLLQGEGWRWLIELAASWLLVMLLTGVYLWWPRGRQPALPQRGARGRPAWKQWHAFLGVALGLVSLVMLSTGLTWSRYAGDQIRALRDATGQAPPPVPMLESTLIDGATPLGWQTIWEHARRHAPDVALQLSPPADAAGSWRVVSGDKSRPLQRFDLLLDAYSGRVLFYAGWERQTLFSQATAIGIPFHRGELGWWNQALLLVFGLGLLFSLISGWVMYFKRRPRGSLGFPRLLPGAWKSPSIPMWVSAVVLCVGLPVLAVSAAGVLFVELLAARLRSA